MINYPLSQLAYYLPTLSISLSRPKAGREKSKNDNNSNVANEIIMKNKCIIKNNRYLSIVYKENPYFDMNSKRRTVMNYNPIGT